MELDDVTGAVIDAAVRVHRELGPGLFESVYEAVLARELERRGLRVEQQRAVPFAYDGIDFEHAFRLDLLVEECVIVEVKSLKPARPGPHEASPDVSAARQRPVGLLLNFGAETMKEGMKRIVNDLASASSAPAREPRRGCIVQSASSRAT